ncbi:hypothetical protein [Veronia pacifica]|uniref:Uncharacterized protein n=1 Tax=Veronia pacifica TaxID=1080227 RepID=A0A1C3E8V5_9GAMM|nr:hypothetical protein [Veronia pacifica]ODA29708.1 hypothetical protein A8L45_21865 [Veronia pacifica]
MSGMTLMMTAAVMVVGAAYAMGASNGELSLLAFVTPALFFIRGGAAVWLLVVGLALYGLAFPYQPVSLSISFWMIIPALFLVTGQRRNTQVSVLVLSVVIAMQCGLLALQWESKLEGEIQYTLMQILGVSLIWLAIFFWKPVKRISWWPVLLLLALTADGQLQGTFMAMCVAVLIMSLQWLKMQGKERGGDKFSVVLPAIGFATIVVFPQFSVPNPVFVSWLMALTIAWLGDYLLTPDDEEED